MDQIWVILLLGLRMVAEAGRTQSDKCEKCECAMTLMDDLAFETTTTDSKGNKVYTNTRYTFDKIDCKFEGLISGLREVYTCKTGCILAKHSNIWHENVSIENANGIVCRTQQQPKIEPNSDISFTCEDTGLVQPSIACDIPIDMHTYCIIKPGTFYVKYGKQPEIFHQLHNQMKLNITKFNSWGYTFETNRYFQSYWISCSHMIFIGKGTATVAASVHEVLEGLVQQKHAPSSLEIANASSHLPDIICKYENLQRLAVGYNKYKFLPKCLHKLTKLKILDVAFNDLESIKEMAFGSEQSKTYLDLSFNKIQYINKDAFSKLTNLVFLSLANNSLTEVNFYLPEYISHVDLSHNSIKYISQTFLKLHNIEKLLLQYNEIKAIDFSVPSSLIHLDLSHNRLKTIDLKMLQKIKYLKRVRFDYNQITKLKDNILHGSEEITILPNLEYLNMSHNQLTVAPLSLIFLNNLHVIDFSHNKIENCTWSDMPHELILKNIDEKIPSCIAEYDYKKDRQRKVIVLHHNKIRSLKNVFNLTIMLHHYATLFCRVNLQHNPFRCDCNMYPYLRALHDVTIQASKNKETDNPMIKKDITSKLFKWNINQLGLCYSPQRLNSHKVMDIKILDQLTCNLLPKEKCKFTYKPSHTLLIVNCSNLKLVEIPARDPVNTHNESLDLGRILFKFGIENHTPEGIDTSIYLNGNNFGNMNTSEKDLLPLVIEHFAKVCVKVLDLSHSNITEIDDWLLVGLSEGNHNLTTLYLNDNNLTNLPLKWHIIYYEDENRNVNRTVPFWKRLTELHLYNNPWDCSCEAKWMRKWLNDLIAWKVLVRPNEIKCATPEWNQNKIVYMLDEKDFCKTPGNIILLYLSFTLANIACVLSLSVVFATIIYRYMSKTILEQVPPSRDNIVNDNDVRGMLYDAFVSYCEADSNWVERQLIPSLQQHDPPFKICDHKRHFVAGMSSQWNEFNAIRHSRRTIIIMSNTYLEREHCMYEFTAACYYWILVKTNPRLVVVKYPDVEIVNDNEMCTAYFRRFTYLAKDEHTFERLVEFMPRESLANTEGARALTITQDEGLGILSDEEQTERTTESYEEELRSEDERFARLWQEAESEAAERAEAGEDIDAEDIFVQKLDSIVKDRQ